jgi:hypothetical protein
MPATKTDAALPAVSFIRLAHSDRAGEFKRLRVSTEVEELDQHAELLGREPSVTERMTVGLGSVVTRAGEFTYSVARAGRAQEWTAVGRCEISGEIVLRRAVAAG